MIEETFIHEIPKGLIQWYDFGVGENVLYITYNDGKHDEMYSVLLEKKLKVDWKTFSDIFDNSSSIVNEYDYIVMGNDIEVYDNPSDILEGIYSCLSPTGKLLLSVNNRQNPSGSRCFEMQDLIHISFIRFCQI